MTQSIGCVMLLLFFFKNLNLKQFLKTNQQIAVGKIKRQALNSEDECVLPTFKCLFQKSRLPINHPLKHVDKLENGCNAFSPSKQSTHRVTVGRLRKQEQLDNTTVSRLTLAC